MSLLAPPGTTLELPGWTVVIDAPEPITRALTALLSRLDFSSEPLPPFRLTVTDHARGLTGQIGTRESWRVSLPAAQPLGTILGQCVAAATMVLRRYLFIHAGVIAAKGRGTIVIGKSGSGKTSTVIRLLASGAFYLSDEVALIDAQSWAAAPFLIPLAIKPWTEKASGSLPQGIDVAIDGHVRYRFPTRTHAGPVAVRNVVLLTPERWPARLSPMSRGEMLLAFGRHETSLVHRERLRDAFAGFARLLRHTRCYALQGAPAKSADLLVDLLARGDF